MRYAIVGTGAIGGFYGARLAKAGKEVHFLLHNDYRYVKERGLKVISKDGDFALREVNAYDDVNEMPPCDVVIVALKTTKNELLKQLLPPLLKPDTLVLLIQNGIGVEADVAAMIPQVHLAAGLAFICAAKNAPGTIRHLDYGTLNIANYNGSEETAQKVAEDFNEAGVKANTVDYQQGRWRKAMWNMPFNGLSVALQAQTDSILANEYSLQLVRDMMNEVVAAANGYGANLSEKDINALIDMTEHMRPYSPSMRLDWDYYRPMEIHYIYHRAIEEAQKVGVEMPRMKMLESILRFMEMRRLHL